jgi:predicted outer membrane repeat protein
MARISGVFGAACAAAMFDWASGAVIYVDDSASGGANNGTSWADAYTNLHDALNAVDGGDELRIAQGVYKPAPPNGDRDATFALIDGVIVQGGYAGVGAVNPDALDPSAFPTTLSGDLNGDDQPNFTNYAENSLHVVTATGLTSSAELRGVIIGGGSAVNGSESLFGGGILCINSTLVLFDSVLQDNEAYIAAGGIYATNFGGDDSYVLAHDCVIRHNRNVTFTGAAGGVMAGPGSTFQDCLFEHNAASGASSGGAITASQTTFESCQFIDNSAGEDGGAVSGANLTFAGCQFSENTCSLFGGAVLGGPHTFTDCTFSNNGNGEQGGAVRGGSLQFRNCAFHGNSSGAGGALFLLGNSSIVQCIFDENTTDLPHFNLGGGAVFNNGNLDAVNCAFRANIAEGFGSAIQNAGVLNAVNCLFNGNHTADSGSTFLNYGNSSTAIASFINCTVVGNGSSAGGPIDGSAMFNSAGDQLTIRNSILWANYPIGGSGSQSGQLLNTGGSISIDNSTVQGWDGSLGGYSNSGDDPTFIDGDGPDDQYGTEDDDPRLSETSPCRDAGNLSHLPPDAYDLDQDANGTEPTPFDLDALSRIAGDVVDLGSFEFQQPRCAADISDADGQVNSGDALAVLNSWGECSDSDCPADVTNDGVVDGVDLYFILTHWGACP